MATVDSQQALDNMIAEEARLAEQQRREFMTFGIGTDPSASHPDVDPRIVATFGIGVDPHGEVIHAPDDTSLGAALGHPLERAGAWLADVGHSAKTVIYGVLIVGAVVAVGYTARAFK